MYVQYGCGTTAPAEWINFDVSTTLRIEKIPLLGPFFGKRLNVKFPGNIRIGDITRGLPGVEPESCDGIFCSHILEHLGLKELRNAVRRTREYLKTGGLFRVVLPDLNLYVRKYIHRKERGEKKAGLTFLEEINLGFNEKPRSVLELLRFRLSHSRHLWMWDSDTLSEELLEAGFQKVRRCDFGDSRDGMFRLVEREDRFADSFALEAEK